MKEHHAATDKNLQGHRRPKNIIENSNSLSAGNEVKIFLIGIPILQSLKYTIFIENFSRSLSCCLSNCAMLAEAERSSFLVAAVAHFNSTVATSQSDSTG
jgi:hypothetical protein